MVLLIGAGVQAVKQKLTSAFGSIEFREDYSVNADSTVKTSTEYRFAWHVADGTR